VGDSERGMANLEYQQLKSEMDRISQVTEYNGKKLLNGSDNKIDFQVGTGADEFKDRISLDTSVINSGIEAMGVEGVDVSSKEGAQSSLGALDSAIEKVSGQRAVLGSLQNRLTSTSNNLQVYTENMSAANSRIRDVDYAEESAKQARNQILTSAGTSVLAQANVSSQNALKLIG